MIAADILNTVRRLVERRQSNAGFSLSEIVVGVMIATMLSLAVTGVIYGSMSLTTDVQVSSAKRSQTNAAFSELQATLRDAERVIVASDTNLTFDYRRADACERHQYTLEADPDQANRLRLRHKVAAQEVSGDMKCGQVDAELGADLIAINDIDPPSNSSQILISGLGENSAFSYQTKRNAEIEQPITADACPSRPGRWDRPNYMDVPLVTVALWVPQGDQGDREFQEDILQTAVRENALGLQCK